MSLRTRATKIAPADVATALVRRVTERRAIPVRTSGVASAYKSQARIRTRGIATRLMVNRSPRFRPRSSLLRSWSRAISRAAMTARPQSASAENTVTNDVMVTRRP
jgi:hypothetical protein